MVEGPGMSATCRTRQKPRPYPGGGATFASRRRHAQDRQHGCLQAGLLGCSAVWCGACYSAFDAGGHATPSRGRPRCTAPDPPRPHGRPSSPRYTRASLRAGSSRARTPRDGARAHADRETIRPERERQSRPRRTRRVRPPSIDGPTSSPEGARSNRHGTEEHGQGHQRPGRLPGHRSAASCCGRERERRGAGRDGAAQGQAGEHGRVLTDRPTGQRSAA